MTVSHIYRADIEIRLSSVDHTLSLLYNSAISRGLPHDLTRNLSFLHLGNREGSERLFFHSPQYWKPQLPSTAYHPPPESQRVKNREARLERWRDLDNSAWGALGQVVRMAEGRHGISLGRVIPLKPGLRKRRGGKFMYTCSLIIFLASLKSSTDSNAVTVPVSLRHL